MTVFRGRLFLFVTLFESFKVVDLEKLCGDTSVWRFYFHYFEISFGLFKEISVVGKNIILKGVTRTFLLFE